MTLRLVFARNVEGGHIAKGFDRSLLHRIREAQGSKVGGGKDDLRALVHELKRTDKWDAVRAAAGRLHCKAPTLMPSFSPPRVCDTGHGAGL